MFKSCEVMATEGQFTACGQSGAVFQQHEYTGAAGAAIAPVGALRIATGASVGAMLIVCLFCPKGNPGSGVLSGVFDTSKPDLIIVSKYCVCQVHLSTLMRKIKMA